MRRNLKHIGFKALALFLSLLLCFPTMPAFAQSAGTTANFLTTSKAFALPVLRGIKIYPDNPFKFDFIIDEGDTNLTPEQLKAETEKLVKYFLAGLTIPEQDLWVNLSPYEADRIIPQALGQTDLGKEMLEQDYVLKQLAASLTYPESPRGREYWQAIQNRGDSRTIPVSSFNKVWIIPESAAIYQDNDKAFITDSKLKVMTEEDYLTTQKNNVMPNNYLPGANAFRQHILPLIEKEVNQGEHFAQLRQIYHSLLLAAWFKNNLKQSIINQVYSDQKKISGVDVSDPKIKEKIYRQYVEAFKQGAYDYVKKSGAASISGKITRQRYFSGGLGFAGKIGKVVEAGLKDDAEPVIKEHAAAGRDDLAQVRLDPSAALGDREREIDGTSAAPVQTKNSSNEAVMAFVDQSPWDKLLMHQVYEILELLSGDSAAYYTLGDHDDDKILKELIEASGEKRHFERGNDEFDIALVGNIHIARIKLLGKTTDGKDYYDNIQYVNLEYFKDMVKDENVLRVLSSSGIVFSGDMTDYAQLAQLAYQIRKNRINLLPLSAQEKRGRDRKGKEDIRIIKKWLAWAETNLSNFSVWSFHERLQQYFNEYHPSFRRKIAGVASHVAGGLSSVFDGVKKMRKSTAKEKNEDLGKRAQSAYNNIEELRELKESIRRPRQPEPRKIFKAIQKTKEVPFVLPKKPVVYYVGIAEDYSTCFLDLDSTTVVGVDPSNVTYEEFKSNFKQFSDKLLLRQGINSRQERERIFNENFSFSQEGSRYQCDFDFNGQRRRMIAYYGTDSYQYIPPEILSGYDILFLKGSNFFADDITAPILLEKLNSGGAIMSTSEFTPATPHGEMLYAYLLPGEFGKSRQGGFYEFYILTKLSGIIGVKAEIKEDHVVNAPSFLVRRKMLPRKKFPRNYEYIGNNKIEKIKIVQVAERKIKVVFVDQLDWPKDHNSGLSIPGEDAVLVNLSRCRDAAEAISRMETADDINKLIFDAGTRSLGVPYIWVRKIIFELVKRQFSSLSKKEVFNLLVNFTARHELEHKRRQILGIDGDDEGICDIAGARVAPYFALAKIITRIYTDWLGINDIVEWEGVDTRIAMGLPIFQEIGKRLGVPVGSSFAEFESWWEKVQHLEHLSAQDIEQIADALVYGGKSVGVQGQPSAFTPTTPREEGGKDHDVGNKGGLVLNTAQANVKLTGKASGLNLSQQSLPFDLQHFTGFTPRVIYLKRKIDAGKVF